MAFVIHVCLLWDCLERVWVSLWSVYMCVVHVFLWSMMYILSGGQVWRTCLLGSCVVKYVYGVCAGGCCGPLCVLGVYHV